VPDLLRLNGVRNAHEKPPKAPPDAGLQLASFLSMVTISPLNFFLHRAAVKSPARSHNL
jgi:hypothetical protein